MFQTFETLNFSNFSNPSKGLLIWNIQMRLEMRCAIRNFWNLSNLSLFETFRWDLKWDVLFETFQTYHGGLPIWNCQMRLEMRCAIWNLSNLSWMVAYLKLSDETWNEMCYLKLLKSFNQSQKLLIWNFQMRLEWDMLFETFWNLKLFTPSQELLIWNFQMRFEMRCAIWNIWNVWNLKLFKHVMGAAYFKLSDGTWKKMWCSKHLKL